jgi:FixJ family two-component response regulator
MHEPSSLNRALPSLLVVDDEQGMRDMLLYELSEQGFDVIAVAGGREAIAAATRRRFDLVLSDLKMPEMDGVEVVRRLKALDPDVEVIVGTGNGCIESAVACMKHGAFDYIQKPYDMMELRTLLGRAAERCHDPSAAALCQASRALLASLSTPELVSLVGGLAARAMKADAVGLVVETGGLGARESHRFEGFAGPPEALIDFFAREAPACDDPVLVRAEVQGPWCELLAGQGFGSALVYPLSLNGRYLGSLSLLRAPAAPRFALSDLNRGTLFASALALAVENGRLHHVLSERMSEVADPPRSAAVREERKSQATELLGAIVREIDTPVGAITAHLHLLRERSAAVTLAGDDAAADRLVADIATITDEMLAATRRIHDLVGQLRGSTGESGS